MAIFKFRPKEKSCHVSSVLWGLQKPSTFDKYVTKFLGTANPIPNFEFADKYVKNNKQIKYFKFIFWAYRITHLEFVSHARFKFSLETSHYGSSIPRLREGYYLL